MVTLSHSLCEMSTVGWKGYNTLCNLTYLVNSSDAEDESESLSGIDLELEWVFL